MTRKEMEQKLRWWLDFIQTDMDSLSEMERSRLQIEFSVYYRPPDLAAGIPSGWWYDLHDLKRIQRLIGEFLYRALRQRKAEDGVIPLPALPRHLHVTDEGRYQITYPRLFYPKKSKKPLFFEKDWLIADFSEILNGIRRDAIKQCGECKRLFLHLSGKKKVYCSAKCSYRFLSRRKREELRSHPRKYQAYLKKQRELMKKKYDEKVKAEHPKARIGRKEV